jgi:alkylation response protein AidB-like acyl-CoA dehydrogenase
LANLQLSGAPDGDHFVVNGSKIWTTFAQHANLMFCLTRTGRGAKKQMGVSFLLIDLTTPGIQVRPLYTIAGDHEFNQVFFNDVRVPRSCLLGEENDGWTVVRYLLQYEHGGIGSRAIDLSQRIDWLKQLATAEEDGEGRPLIANPDFVRRMAEVIIAAEGVAFAERELAKLAQGGGPPSPLGELLSIRSRDVGQAINDLAMRTIGVYGAPFQKPARTVGSGVAPVGPDYALKPMPFYLAQQAGKIAGGTPDIHRNNVAKRLLGL